MLDSILDFREDRVETVNLHLSGTVHIYLNFIREVSLNHLFQIGGKSLRQSSQAFSTRSLSGMNIRYSQSALPPNFVNCHFTSVWFYVISRT